MRHLKVHFLVGFGLILAVGATPATTRAATITVDTVADPGAAGVCALRDAITAANTRTAINGCAAGDGADTITFSVSGTVTLGSLLPAIANASPGSLTIDGSGQSVTVDGAGLYRVLQVHKGATLTVNNLTLAHGQLGVGRGNGGGIDNEGTLTVINSTLSANSTHRYGGGISNHGTLTVTNSIISGSSANTGGGIYSRGDVTVTNSTLSGNSARLGAGIYSTGGRTLIVTISNSSFSGNSAGNFGGGIGFSGGTLTVTHSTFSGNSAHGANGGGIDTSRGSFTTVTNSTFSGNSAGHFGGGIFHDGELRVTNSTFSGNRAQSGGGIYDNKGSTPASVVNSIMAGSVGGNCAGEAFVDGGYNISDDSTCKFTAATAANGDTIGDGVDPKLSPSGLQNNGGPTQTIALQSTSPAIDAIPKAGCPGTDQRGFNRLDNGESACDIGAYEFIDQP